MGDLRSMIEIRTIGSENKEDINILNEPFSMFGKIISRYEDDKWTYELKSGETEEMCFLDENYDYDAMKDSIFSGAYDGQTCDFAARLFQVHVLVRFEGQSQVSASNHWQDAD